MEINRRSLDKRTLDKDKSEYGRFNSGFQVY